MKQFFKKVRQAKYFWFLVIAIIIVLSVGGYKIVKGGNASTVSYVTATPQKGTLIVSVSSNGQVSASNQVDVKAKVSGAVIAVKVKNGQEVKSGDTLVQLDATEALKSVRDAQANLQSAQLSLQKLKQPADSYSVLQYENALTNAKDTLAKLTLSQKTDYDKALTAQQIAQDDIEISYEDSFNKIASAFLDLPTAISKAYDIIYSYEISNSESSIGGNQWNVDVLYGTLPLDSDQQAFKPFITTAKADYASARDNYDKNFKNYKNASRYSSTSTIESLLSETVNTTKSIAQALKTQSNMLDAWVDYRKQGLKNTFSKVTSYQTDLSTYTGKVNTHLSALLAMQGSLKSNKDAQVSAENDLAELKTKQPMDLAAAQQTVKEKELSLAKLKTGTDKLDLQSQEISVQQRQNSLYDTQQKLADYTIKAPFDGVVAKLNVSKGDDLSSASAVATIITKQKLAVISLNEVDVAKVKVGDKATLTFDAIDGLSISGQVAEVDTLGVTTQGVVSYGVTVSFDTQDSRVKSSMSVSVSIITNSKQDVLMVPATAVKNQNGEYYVDVLENGIPKSKSVVVGLSNDTMTEIVSGLNTNDKVVTRTVNSSSTNSTNSTANRTTSGASGAFGIGGVRINR